MSETKSQTPETDAASFDVDVVGDAYTKREYYQGADFVESDFAKSLEISRDQWKAVAERLAKEIDFAPHDRNYECIQRGFCACWKSKALTEFNQLKSK